LVLRDPEGLPLAVLAVAEIWRHDRSGEAEGVFGTLDPAHPGDDHLLNRTNNVALELERRGHLAASAGG
jgi:sulfate adenylyltransferase